MMTDAFLRDARRRYVEANAATLTWMLDRPLLRGTFLNTKQNSLTLADYTDQDGWRGPDYLYGWIQGRGLEALVMHARFFDREDPALARRLDAVAQPLFASLQALYGRFGHAYFCYDADGMPVFPDIDGRPVAQSLATDIFTYSDIFVLKGLLAASTRFDPQSSSGFRQGLARVAEAIRRKRFVMDEQRPLDSEACRQQEDDYGPRMIMLGAAALLHHLGFADDAAFGHEFIDRILTGHWTGDAREASGLVLDVPGRDVCNVGHAIEFAGFALEFLPMDADAGQIGSLQTIMLAAFRAGFTPPGVRLRISARTGAPLSPYFPWWSLPETIRAAALAFGRTSSPDSLTVWQTAHDAFFRHYWRGTPAIAFQTRTVEGPADYVPATPDLDPGYHTGLSLLAAVAAIDRRHPELRA